MAETAKDTIYSVRSSPKTYANFSGLELPERDQYSQTFLKPLLRIGTSTNKAVISTTEIALGEIYSTCALTTGTVRALNIDQTMTVASTTNWIEVLRVSLTANVKVGASSCAIIGRLDLSTVGAAHGEAGAIYAELTVPNSSLERGELYGLGIGIGAGASSSWGSAGPVSFIKFDTWGTVLAVESNAYLFHLAGIGAATAGEIFDTCTAGAASHALKILIGTTPYYIMLQDNVDA